MRRRARALRSPSPARAAGCSDRRRAAQPVCANGAIAVRRRHACDRSRRRLCASTGAGRGDDVGRARGLQRAGVACRQKRAGQFGSSTDAPRRDGRRPAARRCRALPSPAPGARPGSRPALDSPSRRRSDCACSEPPRSEDSSSASAARRRSASLVRGEVSIGTVNATTPRAGGVRWSIRLAWTSRGQGHAPSWADAGVVDGDEHDVRRGRRRRGAHHAVVEQQLDRRVGRGGDQAPDDNHKGCCQPPGKPGKSRQSCRHPGTSNEDRREYRRRPAGKSQEASQPGSRQAWHLSDTRHALL